MSRAILLNNKYLKTVDRADFVLPEFKSEACGDYPLPIGYGQTISQPSTVAFMLELLDPKPSDKILDIGAGSGYQTAILAKIAKKIFAIERIPELAEFAKNNLAKYKFRNIKILCQDGSKGLLEYAPFDKIIVAASAVWAQGVVPKLKKQLTKNGRLVIPIKNSIWLITKKFQREYPGFIFVPLISCQT